MTRSVAGTISSTFVLATMTARISGGKGSYRRASIRRSRSADPHAASFRVLIQSRRERQFDRDGTPLTDDRNPPFAPLC